MKKRIDGGNGIFEGNLTEADPVAARSASLQVFPVVGKGDFDEAGGDSLGEGMGVAGISAESGVERRSIGDGGREAVGALGAGGEAQSEIFSAVGV